MGSNKMCISSFQETMDHEFSDFPNLKVNKLGYKVDGNSGIKKHCNCNDLKSVDYFCETDGSSYLMVEFSDLVKQDHQIQTKLSSIQTSDLDRPLKKELRKFYFKQIHQELTTKFKDSFSIVGIMKDVKSNLDNIPKDFNEKPKYLVVVAPIESHPEEKKIDVIRLIDEIQNKLTNSLPKQLYLSVKVVPLEAILK